MFTTTTKSSSRMFTAVEPPNALIYVRPFDLERLDGVLEIAGLELAAGRAKSVFSSLASNQEAIVLARDEILLEMTKQARDPVRRLQELFRWVCFEIDFASLLYNAASKIPDQATRNNNIEAILQGLADSREESLSEEGVPFRGRGVVELWRDDIPNDRKPPNLALQADAMVTDYFFQDLQPTRQINSEITSAQQETKEKQ